LQERFFKLIFYNAACLESVIFCAKITAIDFSKKGRAERGISAERKQQESQRRRKLLGKNLLHSLSFSQQYSNGTINIPVFARTRISLRSDPNKLCSLSH
jgi:hypothetical protein